MSAVVVVDTAVDEEAVELLRRLRVDLFWSVVTGARAEGLNIARTDAMMDAMEGWALLGRVSRHIRGGGPALGEVL